MNQINFVEPLLHMLEDSSYTPLTEEGLIEALDIPSKQKREFLKLLDGMEREGTVVRVKRDRFVLPKDVDLVCGRIRFRRSGSAFVVPDECYGKQELEIEYHDTNIAFHEDRVLVRIKKPRKGKPYGRGGKHAKEDEDKVFAKVLRVLSREHKPIIGTLRKGKSYFYVVPDDVRISQDILVEDPRKSKLKPIPKVNQKVRVDILEWPNRHINPFGEVTEVFGETHSPSAEFSAIMHKFSLNEDFPPAVLKEAESIPGVVSAEQVEGRKDCRNLFTLTIDPDDAKDFDDALSLEELGKGELRIGIHIADVSAYVEHNTRLDHEAHLRGNSTYLVGTVIPMLPHALSNGICSLVEDADRLTKSVFVTFDQHGQIKGVDFANTVIRSNKRLTYKQAYAFLFQDDLKSIRNTPMPKSYQTGLTGKNLNDLTDEELQKIQHTIRSFWHIASHMRKKRMAEGSLDLDMPEVKIYVDADGFADSIEKVENDESHQLIEEFMLMANEVVAKALLDAKIPFISRVHDEPDPEKLDDLRETLAAYDMPCGDLKRRKVIIDLLRQLKLHAQGQSIKMLFLRSMRQACYRASADGHYGLNKEHYAHFTSPIRRYSDLIVHRIFENYLQLKNLPTAPKGKLKTYTTGELESLAKHLSVTEQNSTEAERESVKVKLLEFFEREMERPDKTSFRATITDVRNHGMFIELKDTLAFGLVKVSSICDDIYTLDSRLMALLGRKTGKRFEIGQEVNVVIAKVDRFQRQMDFILYECYAEGKGTLSEAREARKVNKEASVHQAKKGPAATAVKKRRRNR